jgi:cytoskeletal protein RodZ
MIRALIFVGIVSAFGYFLFLLYTSINQGEKIEQTPEDSSKDSSENENKTNDNK